MHLIILTTLLLFTSCSQKTPKIDGQKNKFSNTFYPAKIDVKYVKEDIFTQKYPIIFMLGGYEGGWKQDQHIRKLQRLGYHVVSIAYYDNAGYSNNLAKVNIDGIKKIIDSYKNYNNIDSNAIGLIGRGKGAELALLMASYYPNIKMLVGISTPHVAFQASRATLATESSWTYKGKEVPFVAYPKLSFSALKSLYRVIVQNDDYRDLHDLALQDKEALKKARIEVENINADIFLASVTKDKMWDSPFMGEKIIQTLKENKFKHHYEHKTYRGTWFLRGIDSKKAWADIYHFVVKSLNSPYSKNVFLHLDENQDKGISFEEYLTYTKLEKKVQRKKLFLKLFNICDSNQNHTIDYAETRIPFDPKNNSDIINREEVYLPSINYHCSVSQNSFKDYDLNKNMSVSFNEFLNHFKNIKKVPSYIRTTQNIDISTNTRFNQCDKDRNKKISHKEAMLKKCQINKSIFLIADKNKDDFISLKELRKLPAKYAQYRDFFYLPNEREEVIYPPAYNSVKIEHLLFNAIAECDNNHDEKLDLTEATTKNCGFTKEDFIKADSSQDGLFSHEDITLKDKMQLFKNIDTNKNGTLNFFEWIKVY